MPPVEGCERQGIYRDADFLSSLFLRVFDAVLHPLSSLPRLNTPWHCDFLPIPGYARFFAATCSDSLVSRDGYW